MVKGQDCIHTYTNTPHVIHPMYVRHMDFRIPYVTYLIPVDPHTFSDSDRSNCVSEWSWTPKVSHNGLTPLRTSWGIWLFFQLAFDPLMAQGGMLWLGNPTLSDPERSKWSGKWIWSLQTYHHGDPYWLHIGNLLKISYLNPWETLCQINNQHKNMHLLWSLDGPSAASCFEKWPTMGIVWPNG